MAIKANMVDYSASDQKQTSDLDVSRTDNNSSGGTQKSKPFKVKRKLHGQKRPQVKYNPLLGRRNQEMPKPEKSLESQDSVVLDSARDEKEH